MLRFEGFYGVWDAKRDLRPLSVPLVSWVIALRYPKIRTA